MRWLAGIIALLTSVAAAPHVHAQTGVHIDVSGSCPTLEQFRRALDAEGITADDSGGVAWRVRLTAKGEGSVELEIAAASRDQVAVSRTVHSEDCTAIAEAFALIVRAHLDAVAEPRPTAIPASEPASESASDPISRDMPEPVTGARPAVRPRSASSGPPGLARRSAIATVDQKAGNRPVDRPSGPRVSLGVATGFDLPAGSSATLRAGQLDVGVTRADGWGLRLVMALSADIWEPEGESSALQRDQFAARLELGWHIAAGPRLWWRPAVAAGTAISLVTASSVPGEPQITRLHPTIGITVAAGLALTDRLSLRAEMVGDAFPIADTYTTMTSGEVGRSPALIVGFGLGLQIDTFWGSK